MSNLTIWTPIDPAEKPRLDEGATDGVMIDDENGRIQLHVGSHIDLDLWTVLIDLSRDEARKLARQITDVLHRPQEPDPDNEPGTILSEPVFRVGEDR